jgi:hypothetical protein
MTTAQILEALKLALVADSALDAWCLSEFDKAPTVWLGIDEQNPPPEEDYPLVAIVGVDQVRGQSRGEIEWRVHLGAGVVNSELTASANARTYPGMLQAEALREHAENALYRARMGIPANAESSGEASSVSYHPLYVSYTTITFSALKTSRRGLP